MASFFHRIVRKEDPTVYQNKDGHLKRTLRVRDFLALGVGTIVSTSIFTLPGVVAAQHAGPAVALSFLLAAIVAGLVAFTYAEMASAMPFAGSAYSWINVLFGEFFGWVAGWALLAEYFIAVAFVASGFSANLRGLFKPIGVELPPALSNSFGTKGGVIDIVAAIVIILTALLLSRGMTQAARMENILVVLKVLAIILFVVVGLTALNFANYVPFIPEHKVTDAGDFGGWQGIYAGVSMIFLAYIGFDSIAANSAEAINPQKTMPRGILGSLIIAIVLFVAVALVLVGMFHYSEYADNAEPVGWALRQSGHGIIAAIVQAISVIGMFTALIGMMLAGSRLLYSFGRDGLLPSWLGKLNNKHLPNRALIVLTIVGVVIGSMFPFAFLAQLISAGTLVAFMFVSIAMYRLRKREGKDLPIPAFKLPLYPVLPAITFILVLLVFWGLGFEAKLYTLIWFVVGIILYLSYGLRHSKKNVEKEYTPPK
ncbi:APC family permease [Staphylococcus simiae]|uniref:Amino acid permease n=1 Tax=Staphylococcus simiae CCM 7213 = CCUG 51256 TaxID=911238 RepID=G5JIC0_9STAP|nr:amino acid permease [Staphylococcus simiae]EHJ08077.1 amino acid permease [Staphylococcus simiae CCM 7213 = CCUG 51256]PNZ12007.1 amino acid permease [Staphylococcus simiae]SNV83026.1 amino acid permease [Staphylococcus simiae]